MFSPVNCDSENGRQLHVPARHRQYTYLPPPAQEGDPEAARKRTDIIAPFPFLEITDNVIRIYNVYLERLGLPQKALRDAMHLAIASAHSIDFLVTWNCAHIANGEIIRKVIKVNLELGVSIPVIVTPEELMKE